MNTYTKIIAKGLKVEISEAIEIQHFIECFYDDFRWGNASVGKIIRTAKSAREDMKDPIFAEYLKVGA